MRGGSPTALLPQTTFGSAARVRKSTLKISGQLGPRAQLVRGSAGGHEAAVIVPHQLFEGEPAEALQEPAFHLTAIDQRRGRVTDILKDVGTQHRVLPREAIDGDFGDGRAVGEIVEGLAASGGCVPVDFGRAVVSLCEQRSALTLRLRERPFDASMRAEGRSLLGQSLQLEATGSRRAFSWRQASTTAAPLRSVPADAAVAEVLGTLSVRVGMMRTDSNSTPSASAAICWILVCRLRPISVPP